MPRNSGGTYSLPAGQPVVSGTTIASSPFNTLTSDLASEVTDSLDRSGKGAMLAALALVNGTTLLPGLTFSSLATLGLYNNSGVLSVAGGAFAVDAQVVTPVVPSLASNWTVQNTVGYWKDSVTNLVRLQGSVTSGAGAGTTILTLPTGFRPSAQRTFMCPVDTVGIDTSATTYAVAITVSNSGVVAIVKTVIAQNGGSGTTLPQTNGAHYWLDPICFLGV